MVAELDGPMYHAGHTHIVYILVLPQHQRLGLVLGLARAYLAAAGGGGNGLFVPDGFGGGQDGVYHLFIAGAAAQIGGERFFHLVPGRVGVLVDEGIGLHHNAGDAKAALHPAAGHKCVGIDVLAILAQPFDGGHRAAVYFGHGDDAGQYRFAVQVYGASAAGGLWGAAILGREDVLLFAQVMQQRGVRVAIIVLQLSV